MREELAGARAGVVDRAEIAFEEDAAAFGSSQDAALLGAFHGVALLNFIGRQSQKARQALDVPVLDLCRGEAAAIGALRAVDLLFYLLGKCAESAFDEVVALEPGAEAHIFLALFFAETPDLHKVRHHISSVSQEFAMRYEPEAIEIK